MAIDFKDIVRVVVLEGRTIIELHDDPKVGQKVLDLSGEPEGNSTV